MMECADVPADCAAMQTILHSSLLLPVKRLIAVFTATRAEYGLLRNTLRHIRDDPGLDLRLIVGGTHLSASHGMTADEITGDGFRIDARVAMRVENNDDAGLVAAMADCTAGLGETLLCLRPDLLLLFGDRYELLPAASLAMLLRIPIAHACGGDVTVGAIDNQVRHALTKMAQLHLAGTQEAANRILQMGEDPARVIVTGQPGLDEFVGAAALPRGELARALNLDPTKAWIIFTYHPETIAADGVDGLRVRTALDVLSGREHFQVVLTAANIDRGGDALNKMLRAQAAAMPHRFHFVASLGHSSFVAMMRESFCVMGNSSAGLIEAASVPVPTINIGQRQRGRIAPRNVLSIEGDRASLEEALARAGDTAFRRDLAGMANPYGDGKAAPRIKDALKAFLKDAPTAKAFHDRAWA